MPLLAEELLATVQKLLRGDVFGLEKYIAWGAEVRSYTLEDARDRDDAVTTLAKDVVAVGLPDRVGSLVSVIADELIANALYVAPHRRRRRAVPRDATRASASARCAAATSSRCGGRPTRATSRSRCAIAGARSIRTRSRRVSRGGKQAATSTRGRHGAAARLRVLQPVRGRLEPDVMTEMIALLDVRYKPTELGAIGVVPHVHARRRGS